MSNALTRITPHIAATTLWWFGDKHHGQEPSEWRRQLIYLISASDTDNRARLAQGFPAEVGAYELASYYSGGLALLRERAQQGSGLGPKVSMKATVKGAGGGPVSEQVTPDALVPLAAGDRVLVLIRDQADLGNTIHLKEELIKRFPGVEFTFLSGADQIAVLGDEEWKARADAYERARSDLYERDEAHSCKGPCHD